jgi:hypothetical protein
VPLGLEALGEIFLDQARARREASEHDVLLQGGNDVVLH